ncbi:MAG: Ldh family oxidoreductase [Chloroflexi bacterium]|nr:Ldh family oxidoreductase [Chloroflexota bacterium]
MPPVKEITIQADALRDFVAQLFARAGIPEADAALVADSLIEADLRGVHSHGVMLIPGYIANIRAGRVNKQPKPSIVRETPSGVLMDGDNGMGQVIARQAMAKAIEKAKQSGVGVASVFHSTHYAAGAYWGLMAAEQNMIGIVLTSAGSIIAPFGGRTRMFGTNPWTITVPAKTEYPVVLDMATSVLAGGKLAWAAVRGDPVPPGLALDSEDRPTTNPEHGLAGRLLPFGGYKGYGLMVMVDMLATLLSGAAIGPEVMTNVRGGQDQNIGHYFQAIDVSAFIAVDDFKARVDDYTRMVRASELEAGSSQVLMPGEREFRLADQRRKDGIPMPVTMLAQLEKLAKDLGVAQPW